ncbi:hypothetical protein ASG29_06570 [Sphingomonas sp. Leaf412]|uniref:hypothetical protein n=1 Tax=Sphingomonas sp. Leaf412 TaxID=1736370 RepID=UPI00070036CD|nr:hypothetical protein [Sphingomonas sp. Leaf412]KQT33670.1 hypothetical protein ASG29_06570 [Sphingomonas sp. Leaf412]
MDELSAAERRHLRLKEGLLSGAVVIPPARGAVPPAPLTAGADGGAAAELAGALPVLPGSGRCDPAAPVTLMLADGGQPFLDLPLRTGLSGRCAVGLEDVWALPLIRAPLIGAVARYAEGRAEATARAAAWAAVALARQIAALGLGASPPEGLPADLFDQIHIAEEARTGEPMHANLRRRLNVARDLVGRIPGCAHVDVRAESVDRPVPDGDCGGISGDVDLQRLLKECAARVDRVVREQTRLAAVLAGGDGGDRADDGDASEDGGDGGGELDPDDADRSELAAFLATAYPGGPPPCRELTADDPVLRKRIRRLGYRAICRIAWPTVSDMVAFAVLIGIQTRYNAGILACLPVDAFISEEGPAGPGDGNSAEDDGWEDDLGDVGAPPAGGDRVVASQYKPRAGREQPVSFPDSGDPWGPAVLVEFVRSWTTPIREHAGGLRGYLFIYARERKAATVCSFATQGGANLRRALAELSRDLGFDGKVRNKDLRPAGVDIIHEATGGDPLMIRAAGWWRNVVTGVRHYLGGPARLRDEERLIWGLKIEHRRLLWGIEVYGRPDGADLFSATDGFRCGDPLRGPLGQDPRELCRARGLCPICPHADVDVAAPAWSCAQMVALADHLHRELAHGDRSLRWRARWRPVLTELLDLWIPLFPDAVVAEARRLPTIRIEGLGNG